MELLKNFNFEEGTRLSCQPFSYVSAWGVRTVKDDSGREYNLHELARRVIQDLNSPNRKLTLQEFKTCARVSAFYLGTDTYVKAQNIFLRFLVWLQDLFSGLTQKEKDFLLDHREHNNGLFTRRCHCVLIDHKGMYVTRGSGEPF